MTGRSRTRLKQAATRPTNDEWLWERSQGGDAAVSVTEVLPVAALNGEAAFAFYFYCHCDAVAIAIPSTNKLEKRHSNEKERNASQRAEWS